VIQDGREFQEMTARTEHLVGRVKLEQVEQLDLKGGKVSLA
jgi:hypothetical protein